MTTECNHSALVQTPSQTASQMESILVEATEQVFGDSGLPLMGSSVAAEALPFGEGVPLATAVVGYAGDTMRGCLVLLTTSEAAARWADAAGAAACYDAVADTMGEFSNMVLGKIKCSLLLRGVTIMLATPTTATGLGIHFPAQANGASTWVRFEAPTGPFYVRFDAVFDKGLELSAVAPATPPAASGEELIF